MSYVLARSGLAGRLPASAPRPSTRVRGPRGRRVPRLRAIVGLLGAGLVLAFPAAAATWSSAGSMAIDRLGHQATLLTDGRVLVTGGNSQAALNGGYDTRSAEIYDPSSNSWSATGSLANGRDQSTATRLANGKVLVAGGINANICAGDITAELYDPALGTWSFTGSLSVARASPTATLLTGGKVLVAGGGNRCGGIFGSAELYDPATGTWTSTGNMTIPRERANAVLLLDGRVLVAGGQTPSGGQFPSVSSAEIFDPVTGTWAPTGSMNVTRSSFALVLLSDGRVLAAAGYSGNGFSNFGNGPEVEIYDPATGVWSLTASTSVARSNGSFSLLGDGRVLAVGGAAGLTTHSSAELWDPATSMWTPTASLAQARLAHTATVLSNGNVLVAAGYFENPRSYLSSAELLVLSPAALIEDVRGDLQELADDNPNTPLGDKAEDVAGKLAAALAELAKAPPDGGAALGNLEGAVGDLEAMVKDGLRSETDGEALMDTLAGAARLVAVQAIDGAGGGEPDKLAEAGHALAEGDALRGHDRFKEAIGKYKDALAKAESA